MKLACKTAVENGEGGSPLAFVVMSQLYAGRKFTLATALFLMIFVTAKRLYSQHQLIFDLNHTITALC